MNAPDKIYIPNLIDTVSRIILTTTTAPDDIEYIRKSALLEWAEGKKKHYMDRQEYDCGWNDLLDEIIDKINLL